MRRDRKTNSDPVYKGLKVCKKAVFVSLGGKGYADRLHGTMDRVSV